MSEEHFKESKEVIAYPESMPERFEEKPHEEEITVYSFKSKEEKAWSVVLIRYWRFAAIATAFAAIFIWIYAYCTNSLQYDSNKSEPTLNDTGNITEESSVNIIEDIQASVNTKKDPPEIMDESKIGVSILDYVDDEFSFYPLAGESQGISVIIIHTHASEYISESISVTEAGAVIAQLLNSAGIGTFHCITEHDKEGSIGAYERMRESVDVLREDYKEILLIIDLHDSDTNAPLTFTVGTGQNFGWKENLRICTAIYNKTEKYKGVIRLLPDSLGQNNGVLTVSIGIGGKAENDQEARNIIASTVNAIISLFNETTPD